MCDTADISPLSSPHPNSPCFLSTYITHLTMGGPGGPLAHTDGLLGLGNYLLALNIADDSNTSHSYCKSVKQITLTNLWQLWSPIYSLPPLAMARRFLSHLVPPLMCLPMPTPKSAPPPMPQGLLPFLLAENIKYTGYTSAQLKVQTLDIWNHT